MTVTTESRIPDKTVLRLNNVGLSLQTIGRLLGCHPTTITVRLKALGTAPMDTRRSFMEDVFFSLTAAQGMWLMDQLDTHTSIRDFVKGLIINAYIERNQERENPDASE